MTARQSFDRFLCRFELFVSGHVLNPLWWGRARRRSRRQVVQAEVFGRYFRKYYLGSVANVDFSAVPEPGEDRIFSVWLQGEGNAPSLVKACYESMRAHCTQELEVLDIDDILKLITLPDVVLEKYRKGRISPAHFTDICRVELLYEHGGVWFDATCYSTAPIPQWVMDCDFFVYLTGPVCGFPYSFMQNCFIRARKGSPLLGAWRAMILEYWSREHGRIDYFQHQLMFKTLVQCNPEAARLFESMPQLWQDPTHRLFYGPARDAVYTPELYRAATEGTFFQKLSFKRNKRIVPGSVLDKMFTTPDL